MRRMLEIPPQPLLPPAIAERLFKKHGISVKLSSQMLYDAVDQERRRGYQDTIRAHLKQKIGHDPILKAFGPGN